MDVTESGFIRVPITDDMVERAQAKASEMGALRNSIRRGAGNVAGFLGEEVVVSAWGAVQSFNTYQHDIVFENVSFEVKTKDRTVPPRIDYEASVANYNPNQQADYYVFVSLTRPKHGTRYTTGYVIGIIEKERYFQNARFLRVGDVDPSNGWKVSADCYNLPYSALTRFESWAVPAHEVANVNEK